MAKQHLELKLQTLTPLWTGGVEGKMDRLHETGIIGSLRWWYEAIVRGLGGDVCDPTADDPQQRCSFDQKAYEQAKQKTNNIEDALSVGLVNVCTVCRLFGCTGWRKRFQLSIKPEINQSSFKFWLATLDAPKKFNHWWLSKTFEKSMNQDLPFSDITLVVSFLPGYENQSLFRALLSIMASYGAIGAKAQYGFGQFDFLTKSPLAESFEIIRQEIAPITHSRNLSNSFYTLQSFWHLQCKVPEDETLIKKFKRANIIGDQGAFRRYLNRYLPVSFDIRYKMPGSDKVGLRQTHRLTQGKTSTREIFGTLIDDKKGSRIFVSHLYKVNEVDNHYWLRVWGFTETEVGDEIQAQLKQIFPKAQIRMATGINILNPQRGAL